ncbi:MAG: DUF1501 domain-containing protein [Pseudomonadota bacterium]
MNGKTTDRRQFLRALLAAGVSGAGGLGALSTLSRAHAAASLAADASQGADGYRALVTVFLYGGNDSFNMVVPTGAGYAEYAQARTNMAVPQAQLLNFPGTGFGFHPSMPGLQALAAQNRVAAGLNTGVLAAPTNRAEYIAGASELPPQLFSHEHQQALWQNARPTLLASNEGWLGRAADLLETAFPQQSLPFNISLQGSNTLQVGPRSVGYAATPLGPLALDVISESEERAAVHNAILNQTYEHPLMREHVAIRQRSLDIYSRYAQAFSPLPQLQTPFAENELAEQLLGVARFIAVSQQLGVQRQAFFVGIGGFDTHSAQLSSHPGLLATLDAGIRSFYDATVELGLANNVTLLTLSEFGRTLGSNGDGTDHGWGGHQLVVGGAVRGGIYGQAPTLAIEGPDDAEEGRLIPTLALEEFLAPAMRWYGVSESELDLVFPNLYRFNRRDLGYMPA